MAQWNAEEYHKSSSEQQRWARELIAKLALRGDERVLDIGCGDGKVTAEIAAAVPRGSVVGVDNSADMVRFAREAFPNSRFANLNFHLKDASSLDFSDEFDVVFSNAALHWVVDHRPVLRGIARAMKHGGKMLLQMGGAGNAAEVLRVLNEMIAEEPWRAHFADFGFPYGFYSPEEYRPWLSEAGLREIRLELIPKDMVHRGIEGLAAWIRTTWLPYTERVAEPQREKFIGDLARRYLERHPLDANGNVHLRMMRLEVEAVKM